MSERFRACLIGVGATTAGILVGALIYLPPAQQIAASMIGAGTAACLSAYYG
jgi:hypothetical protein